MIYQQSHSKTYYAMLQEQRSFGLRTLDLIRAPSRFWSDQDSEPKLYHAREDPLRLNQLPSPSQSLKDQQGESLQGLSRRSLGQLFAWFLACEDSQNRLVSRDIATLAHQASLVQYVLENPTLKRVLIADEVGLGKTIEAALIVQALLQKNKGLRVLYLAPARLVRNVRREFDRLHLNFRIWASGADSDARVTDSRVVASIHRAVHPSHFDSFAKGPNWDVLVVDECHHLSDWGHGGGSPTRKYSLVKELLGKLSENGRVILLSGTPHQGNRVRFENLLRLLSDDNQSVEGSNGRVIYRIKDDIVDWEGKPLFPRREVREPVMLDLSPGVRRWIQGIHSLFSDSQADGKESHKRAAGWRVYQALQWASSSIEAGLGYLVRQAVRAEWTLENPSFHSALAALRPYRQGSPKEPVPELLSRLKKEVKRQREQQDIEDLEDLEQSEDQGRAEAGPQWRPEPGLLAQLLEMGVELLRETGDSKWNLIWEQVLAPAGDEKVVLFAQPIETVTALARYLERRCGQRPAMIIGDQKEDQRQREIEAFWRDDGPQFLISSRAGGEGINLQVARRLVHVDVPWNPMEMEQRVGRVHRFLSRRTILVDTVVVSESREIDMYRVARDKLKEISATMVREDRFEELFSRVMSVVPPEQLQEVLGEQALGPLSNEEMESLRGLVMTGFQSWQSFHNQYGQEAQNIRQLDPGQAGWRDLRYFLKEFLNAKAVEGFSALGFEMDEQGEVHEASQEASVFKLEDSLYACGDYGGMPITQGHERAQLIGLNSSVVASKLRALAFADAPTGAAHLSLSWHPLFQKLVNSSDFGVLVFARSSIDISEFAEASSALFVYIVNATGEAILLQGDQKGSLLRLLMSASIKREPVANEALLARMATLETSLWERLRTPTELELSQRRYHAVFPIFSALVFVDD